MIFALPQRERELWSCFGVCAISKRRWRETGPVVCIPKWEALCPSHRGMDHFPRLLTVPEAAELARVSARTVRDWLAQGRLRAVRPDGRGPHLIPIPELRRFLGLDAIDGSIRSTPHALPLAEMLESILSAVLALDAKLSAPANDSQPAVSAPFGATQKGVRKVRERAPYRPKTLATELERAAAREALRRSGCIATKGTS